MISKNPFLTKSCGHETLGLNPNSGARKYYEAKCGINAIPRYRHRKIGYDGLEE